MIHRYSPRFLFLSFLFVITGCVENTRQQNTTDTSAVLKTEESITPAGDEASADTIKGSIKSEVTGQVGTANIRIRYSSPAVRKRIIWDKLVPYDKVWVTGAHSATTLETDQEIMIGSKKIPAGKYAFFTIPGKDEWTVIINKNWDQHQADKYSPKEDLIRLKIKPQLVEEHRERLRYEIISQDGKKGNLIIHWEKLRLEIPLEQP